MPPVVLLTGAGAGGDTRLPSLLSLTSLPTRPCFRPPHAYASTHHTPTLPPTTCLYSHPRLLPTTRPCSRPHAHAPHPCLRSVPMPAPLLNAYAPCLTTPTSTHNTYDADAVIHPPHHNVYRQRVPTKGNQVFNVCTVK